MPTLSEHLTRTARSATQLGSFDTETSQVQAVAFSPNGRLLAVADVSNKVQLWAVPDGPQQSVIDTGSNHVKCLSFSPDGRRLAVGKDCRTIGIWSVADGTCEKKFEAHDDDVVALTYVGPDGKWLASGAEDRKVKLWATADWSCTATLPGHEANLSAVSASADGRLLASTDEDGVIKIWSLPDGACLATLTGKGGRCATISPDGKLLAADGRDGDVVLWGVAEKKVIATLSGHGDRIKFVRFSPDGRLLVSTCWNDSTVRVWDVADRTLVTTLKSEGQPVQAAFSADGRLLSWGDYQDGKAHLWLLTGTPEGVSWETAEPDLMPRAVVTLVRPDGDRAYAGGQFVLGLSVENTGKAPLYRFRAETKSDSPLLDGLHAFFGVVPPGVKAERWVVADIPFDTPAGDLRAEVEFAEANGSAPANLPVTVAVKPMPRPDVPFTWKLVNDNTGSSMGSGDGVPKRGESIDVLTVVENKTTAELSGLELRLAAVSAPDGVVVSNATGGLPAIPVGGSGEGRVTFAIKPKAKAGPVVLHLTIRDAAGRVFGFASDEYPTHSSPLPTVSPCPPTSRRSAAKR